VSSVVVSLAMLGIIQILISAGRFSTDVVFLRLAALIMVLDSFVITLYGYLRGIQRLEYESLGIIIHRVTIMIVGITSLTLGAKPIWSMIALLSGSIASILYVGTQIWKRRINWHPQWNWAPIKRLLKIAWPFAVAALFIAIYSTSDNILLQMFGGRRSVGLYGTAAKMISAFNQIFPAALVAAIFPAMSASFIQDRQKLQKIFTDSMAYLMVVCVPLMVVLLLLARPIMLAGWGEVWVDAAWPLRILAIGIPFLFLNYPVGYLLNSANLQTKNTINIAITVILNIGANLLFIEKYSYHSVAIISVASSALLFFLGAWRIREVIAVPYRQLLTILAKTLATGGVMALVGWKLMPYVHRGPSAVIVGGILAMIYLTAMMAMGLIKVSQLTQILQRFRRT
jgi:O-antigen/teichoic acid export membrane protein